MVKKAIITGATGAVGTALIKELIEHNVEVLVLCRKDSLRIGNIPVHSLVKMKDCSLDQLSSLENDTGKTFDVFYHFGWAGTTGAARNDMPLQSLNIGYALDAVDLAARFGCRVFIGAGSQAEYGRHECVLKPDTPCFPEDGYGMAKLCAGQMTRVHAQQLDIRHIWVRILSVYGPNDSSQSLIMSVIHELRQGNIPHCTKGEQIWDYLYSGDAAQAFRLLGEQGKNGKIYVLGSGRARPLSEYIYKIRDLVAPNSDVALGALPYRPNQIMHLQADISDLKCDVGWEATTDFSNGIFNMLRGEK